MTKTEIILETAAYYAADPVNKRGKSVNGCVYLADNGSKCAVGRCMTDDMLARFGYNDNFFRGLIAEMLDTDHYIGDYYIVNEPLKPEYQGHNTEFWEDLQFFHDNDQNWYAGGLTNVGKENLYALQTKYANK